MKHCILMETALDGWEKASYWVLAVQQCHHNSSVKAMREGDVVAQAALNMMRGWLDKLIEYKISAMTGETVPEGREKAIVEAYNRSFGGLTFESEPESLSSGRVYCQYTGRSGHRGGLWPQILPPNPLCCSQHHLRMASFRSLKNKPH
jgi:hypothetical protein